MRAPGSAGGRRPRGVGRVTVSASSSVPRTAAHESSGARSRVGVGVRKRHGLVPRSSAPSGSGSSSASMSRGHPEAHEHRLGGAPRPSVSGVPSAITRPLRDHDHAVGEVLRLLHVVRGEQDRLAERAQPGDQLPRLPTRGGVEAGGRLVEEDQLGVAADAEREVEPPALAAGERLDARVRRRRRGRRGRGPRLPAAGSGRRRRRARSPRER